MTKIKVIIGSTRDARFGKQVADWFMGIASEQEEVAYELVDLKTVDLPFLNEPKPPLAGNYQHETTKKWAEVVADADGFVFVTPEYNHSIPASLKNAIDTVAGEWANKPVAYVGYGVIGGVRSIEHLRQIASQLRMFDIRDEVLVINYWSMLDEKGAFQPDENLAKEARAVVSTLNFWAADFAEARKRLAK